MHTDQQTDATRLHHELARFIEVRIDGLVQSAASGPHALTWALRHLVEEIRTGAPTDRHDPRAHAWPEDEDDVPETRMARERHPLRSTQRTTQDQRRTVMIAPDRHERAGQILRHERITYGRLPTWQRHRSQMHGARTGQHGTGVVPGQRVRHGRRGGR